MSAVSPDSTPEELRALVEAAGPWVTGFEFRGQHFGGPYPAETDDRITLLTRWLPRPPQRILECACLEGGHTSALARHYPAASIVALEGRATNLQRARLLCGARGHQNIEFRQVDLEDGFVPAGERYDFILCLGLLYHLYHPRSLIQRMAAQTDRVWVWTQICHDREVVLDHDGVCGRMYREPAEHSLNGLRPDSFFPTLGGLIQMFADAGLSEFTYVRPQVTPNGPAILGGFARPGK